jgi:hypothetical protein
MHPPPTQLARSRPRIRGDRFLYAILKSVRFINCGMSEGNSELLSLTQVASELGVTRQRVNDLIKNGQIVARKLGRFHYIEEA